MVISNKNMASVGADSNKSKQTFILPSALNAETALLSRGNCSCLPATINLNYALDKVHALDNYVCLITGV